MATAGHHHCCPVPVMVMATGVMGLVSLFLLRGVLPMPLPERLRRRRAWAMGSRLADPVLEISSC